jgi:acyl-CoA thioesterase-2
MATTDPAAVLDAIRTEVGVEPVDDTLARGQTSRGGGPRAGLFGGQMIAQSLAACAHTVPVGAVPDSIHANLLRTGTAGDPVDFHVERIRDGGSLQHRDVRGYQGDQLIVHATVVSSVPAPGLDWQRAPMPETAAPDTSPDAPESWRRHLGGGVFDVAHPVSKDGLEPPSHPLWIRSSVELPPDPWLHGAVMAFWSDFGMNWSARATHNHLDDTEVSSLSASHSVWFHRHTPTHDWHLFDVHTQSLAGNQGFVRASLFDRAGGLTASIAQGVFIRHPR